MSPLVSKVKHTDVFIMDQFVNSKGKMYSVEELAICNVGCVVDVNDHRQYWQCCRVNGRGCTSWCRCAKVLAKCLGSSFTVRRSGRQCEVVITAIGTRRVEDVNKQLEKVGYNIGVRITEDFLARTKKRSVQTQ